MANLYFLVSIGSSICKNTRLQGFYLSLYDIVAQQHLYHIIGYIGKKTFIFSFMFSCRREAFYSTSFKSWQQLVMGMLPS